MRRGGGGWGLQQRNIMMGVEKAIRGNGAYHIVVLCK